MNYSFIYGLGSIKQKEMKALEPYNEKERRMVCWAWWEHSSRCEEACQEEEQMCSVWLQRVKLGRLLWRGWPLTAGRGKTEIMAGQVCLRVSWYLHLELTKPSFFDPCLFIILGKKAAIWTLIMKISPIEKSFFFFFYPDLNADFRKKDFFKKHCYHFFFQV